MEIHWHDPNAFPESDRTSAQARIVGPPERGVTDEVRASEGYGFILTDGGERVYFHRNALHGGFDFERLEEEQRVGLNIEGGEKGLQATVVRPPPHGAPAP